MTHDPREALEPCPFCGGDNVILSHKLDYGFIRRYSYCNGCGARGPSFNGEEEARAWWNTRALTASPGEQKPVAWRYELAGCRVWENCKPVGWSDWKWRISETKPNAGEAMRNVTPLYLSAPPAAGWNITDDMVERACKAYADATGYYVEFHRGLSSPSADGMRKGMRAALSALRREAPAPEGVMDDVLQSIDPDYAESFERQVPPRPDAGGGVRDQIAALAHRFWSIHPSVIAAKNLTREEFYAREMTALFAALSTPSDAVNESAEARLREAKIAELQKLGDVEAIKAVLIYPDDGSTAVPLEYVLIRGFSAMSWAQPSSAAHEICEQIADLFSAGGDEAKKSEGGVEGHARSTKADSVRGEAGSAPSKDGSLAQLAAGIKPGPSDTTAERREIVARIDKAISAGGDEAKKSEGGCICQDQHRRGYCTEPGCPYAVRPSDPTASAYGDYTPITVRASTAPSSPTAERREIVARFKSVVQIMRSANQRGSLMCIWDSDIETMDKVLATLDGGAGE